MNDYNSKFNLKYLSGGENAYIFKNLLIQKLIANNMYDTNSKNIISITMTEDEKYQSASINKVAARKLNILSIYIKIFNKRDVECVLFDNNYASEQGFLLANSSANLSNVAADDDIFLINSENISLDIIDDLSSYHGSECITFE